MFKKTFFCQRQTRGFSWLLCAKKIFFIFLIFVLVYCCATVLASSKPQVVINEIAWAGTKIDTVPSGNWWQYEWIELYNDTTEPIDLANWTIEGAKSKNTSLIIKSGIIETKGYFIICKKEMAFCHYVDSGLSLNNQYDKNGPVIIKDASLSIIDATPVPSGSAWPYGNNQTKQTMERINPQNSGEDILNWQTSALPNGTPSQINSKPDMQDSTNFSTSGASSVQQIDKTDNKQKNLNNVEASSFLDEKNNKGKNYENIFINEIMPAPIGADSENEWIEIYNGNDFKVTLTDWQLKDQTGATTRYHFPSSAKIAAYDFLLLPRTESKITLNNNADGVELLNPSGAIIDSVSYTKAPKGQSWSKIAGFWQWSAVPTPGQENIVSNTEQLQTPSSTTENQFLMAQTTKTIFPNQTTGQQNNLPAVNKKKLPALIAALLIALASSLIAWQIKKRSTL